MTPHGELELAREGGHTLPRVVHAGGSATGAEVERALVDAVQRTIAAIHEHAFALDLIVEGGRCRGVIALFADGSQQEVRATNVLVTTGGAGQMYAVTTNPVEATGDGIAMALRAGVAVADLEFIQFHPTALHHRVDAAAAAVRGAPGSRCAAARHQRRAVRRRDAAARRRVPGRDPADARARRRSRLPRRHRSRGLRSAVPEHRRRAAARSGSTRRTDWLPVAPAAHYTCGGIVTDLQGAILASRVSGRPAKRRARVCTAPIAWRRTRCSRAWCSGRERSRPSRPACPGPEVTGAMRSVLVDDGHLPTASRTA